MVILLIKQRKIIQILTEIINCTTKQKACCRTKSKALDCFIVSKNDLSNKNKKHQIFLKCQINRGLSFTSGLYLHHKFSTKASFWDLCWYIETLRKNIKNLKCEGSEWLFSASKNTAWYVNETKLRILNYRCINST